MNPTSSVTPPTPAPALADRGREHLVQFYESDDALAGTVAAFLHNGLASGEALVVIATEPHRNAIAARLKSLDVNVTALSGTGRLHLLDARETLAKLMVDGLPDAARFEATVSRLVSGAAQLGGSKVRAYGEMVDLLWRDGNPRGALLLEELWNGLQHRHAFSLLCAYAMASFYREPQGLQQVCATHTHVLASPDGVEPHDTPLRAITAEIAQRKQIETDLKAALRALHQREEELRDFVENAALSLHWVGADGTILWANRTELQLLGYAAGEYLGRPISDFHVDRAVIDDLLARLRGKEAVHGYPARLRAKDGTIKHVEISSNALWRDGRFVHTRCFTRDVTERVLLQGQREAASGRDAQLAKITSAIADAITEHDVFAAVVDRVGEALGASSAGLFVIDGDGQTVRLVRGVGYAEHQLRQLARLPLHAERSLPAVDCCRDGAPLWLDSQAALLERYPHLAGLITPLRSYGVACVPVIVRGKTLGALAFTFEGAAPFPHDQRDFLQTIAGHCGQSLERLRLLEVERESRERAEAAAVRLAVLDRASQAFGQARAGLAALLQAVAEQVTREFADGATISFAPEDDGRLELVAVSHRDPAVAAELRALSARRPSSTTAGLTGQIVQTGRPLFIANLAEANLAGALPGYADWLQRNRVRSLIYVPLRTGGKVVGMLGALRQAPRPAFVEDDQRLVEELAERAAHAVEASRLQRDNQQAWERAELLYALAASVIRAERVEEVFDVALDAIQRALGAERSAVLQYDMGGVMRFQRWRGLSDAYRRAVEGHSPWPRDAKEPRAVLVPDALADESLAAYRPLLQSEGIGALAFIPLVADGRLLGKMMVYHRTARRLSTQELDMAKAIADHVAGAIARFSVMAELRETVRYNELFAGVLAHDLRNPLGAIMASAQLALRRLEGEGDKNNKPLGRIINSGERMARMVDQLLDFTRARVGGGFQLEPREVDLGELTRQVIDELLAGHPEWSVTLESPGDASGRWDADRLGQVVSNLVANACQHGAPGAPVRARVDGTRPDEVLLEVRNLGRIPEPLMDSLFDPFRRARHGRGNASGLGLGLFITRELVVAHGGTVDVASSDEAGTCFTVQLPRRRFRA